MNNVKIQGTIKGSIFSLLSYLQQTYQNYNFLVVVSQLVQFVLFLYITVHDHLLQFQKWKPYYQSYFQITQDYIHNVNNSRFTLITVNILAAIQFFLIAIFIINSQYNKTNKGQTIAKIVKNLSFLLFVLISLIITVSSFALATLFQNYGFLRTLPYAILPIFIFLMFHFAIRNIFLYSWIGNVLAFLLIFQNIFIQVFFLLFSWYMTLKTFHRFQKVVYGQLFIFSFWVTVGTKSLQNQVAKPINSICLIYAPLLSLFALAMVIFFHKQIQIKNQNEDNQFIFQIVSGNKSQNLKDDFKFKQLLKIATLLSQCKILREKINSQEHRKFKYTSKDIKNFKKSQVLIKFTQLIQDQVNKKNNMSLTLMLLRLKILKKDPLIQIYKQIQIINYQANKKINLSSEFQVFKVLQYAKKELFYQGKSEKQSKVFQIIQIQEVCEKYKNSFQKIIVLLHSFWTLMTKKSVYQPLLDQKFDQILQEQVIFQKYHAQIISRNNAPKEQKMYKLIKMFLLSYNKKQIQAHDKIDDQSNGEDISSYMIFDQQKIFKASFQLNEDLNYNEDDLINHNKDMIFSDVFSEHIDNKIANLLAKNKNQEFIAPVFNNKKKLALKMCKLFIYPAVQQKMKFLISFKRSKDYEQSSLIIYAIKSDSIQYYNQKFISSFGIDQQKLSNKINKNKLISHQIFHQLNLGSRQVRQQLKVGRIINFILHLKQYLVVSSRTNKIMANIKLVQMIQTNVQTYMILLVKKGNGSANFSIKHLQPQKIFIESQSNSYQNLVKLYQNQTFFCKIPNNHQGKIQQKQVQLQDKGRNSFLMYFYIFFLVAIICTISQAIYSKYFSQNRASTYKYYSDAVTNVSEQYALLFQAYSCAFKRYHAFKYPGQYFSYNVSNPYQLAMGYGFGGQYFLKTFENIYLQYLKNQPNSIIAYNLTFNYFNVTTNTSASTLLDYSQNLKLYFSGGKLDFLLKNYIALREVTIQFQQTFVYKQIINKMLSNGFETYIIFIVLIIISMILCIWILIKVQRGIVSVYDILNMTTEQGASEIIKSIENIMQQNKISPDQRDQILVDTEKSLKYFPLQPQKTKSYLKSEAESQSQHQSLIKNSRQQRSRDQINLTIEKRSIMDRQAESHVQKIKKNEFVMKILRYSIIVLFFCVYCFMIVDDYITIQNQSNQIFQILQYKTNLYKALTSIKRNEVSDSFQKLYQDYFNQSIVLPSNPISKYLLTSFQTELPPLFDNFKKQEYDLLYGDLCKVNKNSFISFMPIPCQKTMNGIFTQGYSKAYQAYKVVSAKLRKLPLSQYYDNFCTVSYCPLYQQAFFSILEIGQLLRLNIEKFESYFLQYQKNAADDINIRFIRNLLIILSLFGIFIFAAYKMRIYCHRSIRYFSFMPKSILFQPKIVNYIRREQVLEKMNCL